VASHLRAVVLWCCLPIAALAGDGGPASRFELEIARAEQNLQQGEREMAESHYRAALLEGFLLLGALEAAEGRLPEAKEAFRRAGTSAVETRRPRQALALAHLQAGEPGEAVDLLARLVSLNARDDESRRLLVQARLAHGQPELAVQDLEEAHTAAPDDLELTYLLATGYLRIGKADAAAPLFAELAAARPLPQTHVLIGRAWRDGGHYERARTALHTALQLDPRARRAHYYLGMVAVLEQGVERLEEAIAEFRQELAIGPGDPAVHLRLGMALVEAQRPAEALPSLEIALRVPDPSADAELYRGRALLALGRAGEAVPALERALALATAQRSPESQVGSTHYQLALALRKTQRGEDAARHFAEAERMSAQRAETSRDRLTRYLSGAESEAAPPAASAAGGLQAIPGGERERLRTRVRTALARAYLNLGIMHAQAERPARAAELIGKAAELEPTLPGIDYPWGVALFGAARYEEAAEPLARALAAEPARHELRRMLALARLNAGQFGETAFLLRDDPELEENPSLLYAYGLALVRGGRADDAQRIFGRLLERHAGSAPVTALLGQAQAQQGDYPAAIETLERALELDPQVPDANGALGYIHLKQGRLAEAEEALRRELAVRPEDVPARQTLATVLDLQGRRGEALPLLRGILRARPTFSDARYLLGKVLLAEGQAPEAAEHLEAAARLAPADANVHYQLGQAYQKLGRPELAEREFAAFRELKDRSREVTP
jgi:tetratricopeptide (TPR) repeat protein